MGVCEDDDHMVVVMMIHLANCRIQSVRSVEKKKKRKKEEESKENSKEKR